MGIIETCKDAFKLAQQLGSTDIQQKVVELQTAAMGMQQELQTLRTENAELKNVAVIDGELVLEENAYHRPTAAETRRGPFCKTCWDTKRKLVSLNTRADEHQECPACKGIFPTTAGRQIEERQRANVQAQMAERKALGSTMRPLRR